MRTRRSHAVVPALLLLLVLPHAPVEARRSAEPRFSPDRALAFDAALEAERERQALVGLAVGVVEHGKLVHVGAYGFADREAARGVIPQTRFRWASVAKVVTAVATLQLVERHELRLDDPASTWWDGLPEGLAAVPVEALLRHQGGVAHYREMGDWKRRLARHYGNRERVPWDAARAAAVVAGGELLAAPYERYHYTTFGYLLLGALVEKAGQAPFEKQVADRIAGPLRMTTFEPDYEFVRCPERTKGYRKRKDRVVASSDGDVSWKLPGGGYHSTVGDMGRFAAGLLGTTLLGDAMRRRMVEVRAPAHGSTSYGMGIGVSRRGGVVTRLAHSGAQSRTRTLLVVEPPRDRGLVVMTNSEWADVGDVETAAREALGW